MIFVAQINDNVLRCCTEVDTIQEGIEMAKKIVIENMSEPGEDGKTIPGVSQFRLTAIETDLEFIYTDEQDHTNSWSVCIGQTE